MLCVDVNVLVYAHRPESPDHDAVRAWLEAASGGLEPVGLIPIVASGFLRIVTNPRIFKEPTPIAKALEFVDELRSRPNVKPVLPGARHWSTFDRLCRESGAAGNTIPDAFLAAIAIEQNATWVSADRGFARFKSLRWRHPLDD